MKKYFSTATLLSVFGLATAILFFGLRLKSQSFYFSDETDHITNGWMMLFFHKALYVDLVTNHQPIPVLMGAVFSSVIKFHTLFDLIERIRLINFLIYSLCGLVIALRFRWSGLLAYILTYSVGYYFFSWYVLAESIVIPGILYIFLFLGEKFFFHKEKLVFIFDYYILGLSLFLIFFSLIPLWPFCAMVGLFLFYTANKKSRWELVSSFFVPTLFLFLWISPTAWYEQTVYNNLNYFIPYDDKVTPIQSIKILFFPFVFFKSYNGNASRGFFLTVLFEIFIAYLYFRKFSYKKKKKEFWQYAFLYLLLISLNSRVRDFPLFFFTGFHLYPFIAGFFSIFGSIFVISYNKLKKAKFKPTLLSFPIILFISLTPWLLEKTDKLNEYYVQYGTQDSYARVMSLLKQPNDTFFSEPNGHGYMNMMSGLPISGKQLFHLQWAYRSPKLRTEFQDLMLQNPPTFIYLTEDSGDYYRDLQPFLKSEYTEILHGDKATFFYIRSERTTSITDLQMEYLREKDFSLAAK